MGIQKSRSRGLRLCKKSLWSFVRLSIGLMKLTCSLFLNYCQGAVYRLYIYQYSIYLSPRALEHLYRNPLQELSMGRKLSC